jgi:hypothetical protein
LELMVLGVVWWFVALVAASGRRRWVALSVVNFFLYPPYL